MEDSYDTVLYKASHRSAVEMIFKTNFQGFSIRPIDMYDLLQKKYPTVNKITNACLKKESLHSYFISI